MKLQNILILLIVILSGIMAYFGYVQLNQFLDYSLFCGGGSTECYDVTRRWIIYDVVIVFIIFVLFLFLINKIKFFENEHCFWLLVLIFALNLHHLGGGSSWNLLDLPLNSLLLAYFLFFKSSKKQYIYISIFLYFLNYIYLIFGISELFYYNQKYVKYESILYYYHALLIILFIFLRIRALVLNPVKF